MSYESAAATILRTVTSTLPHTWCPEHGWHDPATDHDSEVSQ